MDAETIALARDLKERIDAKQKLVKDQAGKVYTYAKDGSLRRLTPKTSKKARKKKKRLSV